MNGYTLTFCIVALVLMTQVMRMWIRAHYGARSRDLERRKVVDEHSVEDLTTLAQRLEQRLATLETILDKDFPDWRRKI